MFISVFGDEDVEILVLKFVSFIHLFIHSVLNKFNICIFLFRSGGQMPISWQVINSMFHYQCQNVLGLIDLILTLPAASTDAERGFSKMKYAKNDFRSCLSDDHLIDQMMIMLDGKTESMFDP